MSNTSKNTLQPSLVDALVEWSNAINPACNPSDLKESDIGPMEKPLLQIQRMQRDPETKPAILKLANQIRDKQTREKVAEWINREDEGGFYTRFTTESMSDEYGILQNLKAQESMGKAVEETRQFLHTALPEDTPFNVSVLIPDIQARIMVATGSTIDYTIPISEANSRQKQTDALRNAALRLDVRKAAERENPLPGRDDLTRMYEKQIRKQRDSILKATGLPMPEQPENNRQQRAEISATSMREQAEQFGQDFLEKYDLDQQGDGDCHFEGRNLEFTAQASNGTTVNFTIPLQSADDLKNTSQMEKNIARAFSQAVQDLDPDKLFKEAGYSTADPGYSPSEEIRKLEEDKTELTLDAAQALQDAGLDPGLDPEMNVLNVKMSAYDIQSMLADAGLPPTPRNIIEATQGGFAGRDGYYLAGFAAKQGADMLRQVVKEGRANQDYGFDLGSQGDQPEQAPTR